MPSSITSDLLQDIAVLVILPLIIWMNLRPSTRANPVHARLWHDYANLMRVSMVILALLSLYAACSVLADLGFISAESEETMAKVIGIPFLIGVVVMIPVAIAAAFRALRGRNGHPREG